MLILNSPQIMQETALRWKKSETLTLVPTMGSLHEGHLRLMRKAKAVGGKTIASIFVNPLQFGPKEDFAKYPRHYDSDVEKLEAEGIDCLFFPSTKDFYPETFQTKVTMGFLTNHLCGKSRPGHFDGVATVCLKLFECTAADVAVFGEKDFQQLRVIQQLSADLNLPVRILPHSIVREDDGLALSSRNAYLTPEERGWAKKIPESVALATALTEKMPTCTAGDIVRLVSETLTSIPLTIDYVAVASEWDLNPVQQSTPLSDVRSPRLFLAVKCGATRLIDNISLERESS